MGFGAYAVRRGVDRLLLLIALVILNWFLLEGLPEALGIDPAVWFLPIGHIGKSSQFQHSLLVSLTDLYGFNKPIYVQFVHYFYLLFTLHFYDFQHHEFVVSEIMRALPYTVVLTVPPLIFQTILAILLGSYAALKRNKIVDHIISNYLVLQYNIPGFFILVIFWVLLAIYIKIIPISDVSVINWSNPITVLKAYWLPWIIITFIFGFPVRGILMRNTMIDILDSDFIKYARLVGYREKIVRGIARRNSLIPVITRTAIDVAFILSGIFFVEYIFGIPGMGYLLTYAALELNLPLVEGSFFILTAYALAILYVNDLIYPLIDPRIKLR